MVLSEEKKRALLESLERGESVVVNGHRFEGSRNTLLFSEDGSGRVYEYDLNRKGLDSAVAICREAAPVWLSARNDDIISRLPMVTEVKEWKYDSAIYDKHIASRSQFPVLPGERSYIKMQYGFDSGRRLGFTVYIDHFSNLSQIYNPESITVLADMMGVDHDSIKAVTGMSVGEAKERIMNDPGQTHKDVFLFVQESLTHDVETTGPEPG